MKSFARHHQSSQIPSQPSSDTVTLANAPKQLALDVFYYAAWPGGESSSDNSECNKLTTGPFNKCRGRKRAAASLPSSLPLAGSGCVYPTASGAAADTSLGNRTIPVVALPPALKWGAYVDLTLKEHQC